MITPLLLAAAAVVQFDFAHVFGFRPGAPVTQVLARLDDAQVPRGWCPEVISEMSDHQRSKLDPRPVEYVHALLVCGIGHSDAAHATLVVGPMNWRGTTVSVAYFFTAEKLELLDAVFAPPLDGAGTLDVTTRLKDAAVRAAQASDMRVTAAKDEFVVANSRVVIRVKNYGAKVFVSVSPNRGIR